MSCYLTIECWQRISTVVEMRWSKVDLQEKVWLLPASSEVYRTKSQESRKVSLSDYLQRPPKDQHERTKQMEACLASAFGR